VATFATIKRMTKSIVLPTDKEEERTAGRTFMRRNTGLGRYTEFRGRPRRLRISFDLNICLAPNNACYSTWETIKCTC